MPVVPAASIPYTPYPTIEPEVRTPRAFEDVRPTPQVFGARIGEAEQGLGRTIERGGDVFAEAALRQQELANSVAAARSSNWVMDEVNKISDGDPNKPGDTGFRGMQGQTAVDNYKDVRDRATGLYDQARSSLANPRQQLMFDQETRRLHSFALNTIGQHYVQQLQKLQQETFKAKVDLAGHRAGTAAATGDDTAFQQAVGEQMIAARDHNTSIGGNQEMLDATFADIRSKAVHIWATNTGVKDANAAMKFIEANKDALGPEEYPQLMNHYKTLAAAQSAQEVTGIGGAALAAPITPITVPDQYKGLVTSAAKQHGVPEDLLSHVLSAESGFDPNAVGPPNRSGQLAQGIAQFLPSTAKQYNIDPRVPEQAIPAAANYLADLKKQTGSWAGAVRAYLGGDPAQAESYVKAGVPQLISHYDQGQPDTIIGDKKLSRPVPPIEPNEIPDQDLGGVKLTVPWSKDPVSFSQMLQHIDENTQGDAIKWQNSIKLARQQFNMAYQDRRRQLQDHDLFVKKQVQEREDQYYKRMAPGSPNPVTDAEILSDPVLGQMPDSKAKMVGFNRREGAADPAQQVDKANAVDLFSRMNLPDGDQKKITTEKPINDAYIGGQITKQTHKWAIEQFRDKRTENGELLSAQKKNLLDAAKMQIEGPFTGETGDLMDAQTLEQGGETRKMRMYRFIRAMDTKIAEYQKAGKNPDDLFNPTNSDFLGSKDALKAYAPPLSMALKDPKGVQAPIEYKSPEDVASALRSGRITYEQATQTLTTKWPDRFHIAPSVPPVEAPIAR